ncbi:MAG: hypothetical protein HKN87_04465, partial [Saprospiraceae bacterium]|nr:hypothetical protein [Saprospiraceae bacterium]
MGSLKTNHNAVERYQGLFDVFANRLNGQRDTRFFHLREKAMRSFCEIGFPDRKDEDYKYTNLTQLLSVPFQTLPTNNAQSTGDVGILEESHKIYFLNGKLNETKSDLGQLPDQVQIMTIEQALQDAFLAEKVAETLQNISEEKVSAFTLLSVAFA